MKCSDQDHTLHPMSTGYNSCSRHRILKIKPIQKGQFCVLQLPLQGNQHILVVTSSNSATFSNCPVQSRFVQSLYFDHNLLILTPIDMIQNSRYTGLLQKSINYINFMIFNQPLLTSNFSKFPYVLTIVGAVISYVLVLNTSYHPFPKSCIMHSYHVLLISPLTLALALNPVQAIKL